MAKVESEIKLNEKVANKDRKFGSAEDYFPAYVTGVDGKSVPALFTGNQLEIAIDRAKANTEDVPEQKGGFLFGIFG